MSALDVESPLAAMSDEPYESRLIKPRTRRTNAEIEALKAEIISVVAGLRPMTIRQLFYQLVSRGTIAKTENEYKNTVVRLASDLRREKRLPYNWIADNTRWQRKPDTHSSLETMLQESADFYRRSLWNEQNSYVEIWLEKDALSGVLYQVTSRWDVPLMVTRGYASLSFLAASAEAIEAQGKPAFLYYFGDHDPSGVDIPRQVEKTLRALAPSAEIYFERVAVNRDQIVDLKLPTRPTKSTDSRAKSFEGESVEVDAISPDELRNMCEQRIAQHVNPNILERTFRIEKLERESLQKIALDFSGGGAQ